MTLQDVVIVGAGLAGLTCARRLQQSGYRVAVVEKSRGVGGRMATRRTDGVPMDHGARFVQPHGEKLRAGVKQLQAQGVLRVWEPHRYRLDSSGQLNPEEATAPYYVAPAGMSAVGKAIADALPVYRHQRAIAITPTPSGTWQITTHTSAPPAEGHPPHIHTARAIVLAIPAPQAIPLLEPWCTYPGVMAQVGALAVVRYAPCITVMAEYDAPVAQAADPLPCPPMTPWMVEGHGDSPFFWVGLDSSKRSPSSSRDRLRVVLQSSAAFAEPWSEAPDLQPAGEALLVQGARLIAAWMARPVRWQVHRWRYSLVEQPCPQGLTVCATDPLPWVACGDWGGDRALDTALESGWEAAERIHAAFSPERLPPFPTGFW